MKSLILLLVLVSTDSEAQVYSENKKEVLYQREKPVNTPGLLKVMRK
jgi:hypothetical protein